MFLTGLLDIFIWYLNWLFINKFGGLVDCMITAGSKLPLIDYSYLALVKDLCKNLSLADVYLQYLYLIVIPFIIIYFFVCRIIKN